VSQLLVNGTVQALDGVTPPQEALVIGDDGRVAGISTAPPLCPA
jgi:hypothetical protein